jgi:hypothetical protein
MDSTTHDILSQRIKAKEVVAIRPSPYLVTLQSNVLLTQVCLVYRVSFLGKVVREEKKAYNAVYCIICFDYLRELNA